MIFTSKPIFSPRPWGDKDLNKLYNYKNDLPIGEVWLLSDFQGMRTPLKGKIGKHTYPDEIKNEFAGFDIPRFPLLIKLISAKEWLSVQVHPDDINAREFEKEPWGKTECWYFLTKGKIAAGFKVSTSDIETVSMDDLQIIETNKGDLVFIEPGLVHTLGPSSKLIEVQQASDATYRIYDWDRGRELHTEKAKRVTDFKKKAKIISEFTSADFKYFTVKKTLSASGTGIAVTLENKPKLYVLIDDIITLDNDFLWVTMGKKEWI
ncbi:MAG: phosphoheptose isomerase [Kosmotoga sp.]|nr:MAG: phosphoheptose isomerase [Kosmotoga sp.]